jgi:hypothetical protein
MGSNDESGRAKAGTMLGYLLVLKEVIVHGY